MLLFWMIDSRVLFVVWRVVLFDILVRFFSSAGVWSFSAFASPVPIYLIHLCMPFFIILSSSLC
jgi:hypothetical protein